MAVDLFRTLDIHNRKTFNQKGREGKEYRRRLMTKTLEIEKDLRNILPSNYSSSITGPNYSIALRAYAIEFSRIRLAIDDLQGDTYFNNPEYGSNRADIAYQKLGSMLALNKNLNLSIFSSQEFLQFILSLVEIFFGGSTPENIKKGIEKFVGETNVATIRENFKDARQPHSAYDISDQFGFRVDFELTDEISQNFQDIAVKLNFLLKLIKPAHTLYVLRFLFSDLIDFISNADDSAKIENIWDHGYDDVRRYWEGVRNRDRLGSNTPIQHTEVLTNVSGTVIYTERGPISKNQTSPELASTSDVTVLVNGSPVTVSSVSGAAGIIILANAVTVSQVITMTYYYWKNVAFQMTLNVPGKVIGGTDRGRYPVQWVLNNIGAKHPQAVTWSYGGFERAYTSLLNDPTVLILNEPPHKISDSNRRVYGHRHVLNWANYVKSPDQTDVDGFDHTLNEGTPIVEKRIAFNPIFEFNDGVFTNPNWEGWGEQAWGSSEWGGQEPSSDPSISVTTTTTWNGWSNQPWSTSAWGGDSSTTTTETLLEIGWNIMRSGGHFANPLDITHTEDSGETGLIHVAHDDGLIEVSIDTAFTDQYQLPTSIYIDNSRLFIANVSNLNGTDLLNNFAGVSGFELTQELVDTPSGDTYDIVSGMNDDESSTSSGGSESRGESYDYTGMFILGSSGMNGSDVLWSNLDLGHWNDEGYIMVTLGATTSHLVAYEKALTAGAP